MTRSTAATAMTGLLMFTLSTAAAEPTHRASDDDTAQLKALQDERIVTLTELVKWTTQQYQEGRCSIQEFISAQDELVAAQLDSADGHDQRIALLTKQVELADTLLKFAEARHQAGQTTRADVYRAKSSVLAAKIRLLRERSGAKPRTPSPPG